MKILADENMPYVQQLFADLGTIETVNGRMLTAEQVQHADVLLVRSVTQVNAQLLALNSQLKFVGSATIGTDHIDLDFLASRNIPFSNAPGCNATAVGEFAFIAMLELAQRFNSPLKGKVVGIVGAGNTGTAVAKCLEAYGIEVLLCDPLLQQSGDGREFVSLDVLIARADIISLHVPITKQGEHKTWYLFDEQRLNSLKQNTWLLNCCRGEVIDNRALIKFKQQRDDVKVVLDVWEGEPNPMAELVPYIEFCTPHIAGYSLEGKARGTYMLYQQLAKVLNIKADKQMDSLLPSLWSEQVSVAEMCNERALLQLARFVYDLRDDDELFRKQFLNPQGFDQMRKNHTHRREFSALKVGNTGQTDVNWLSNLGFSGVEL
ncbi:4-phosphoerythronate dehydrogenase [Shewanella fidelis]|uniref:Erythronate-4-phosphate dehydrogenase n=1 Tax=Shewanella fidelis TaxID=173509 RepID=A0AAW8NJ93_9GAMM|nr:4-phosphoerythronate dehydrogenase [Shewanella fidelis]MDR8523364.1 4-phosphoerythronate dehydrogenase [Shewanella fidelis]MDW4813402.1 4-phosphoerythronate dehydrogenase [Shewanella fidelis]MDW4817226.1 4-phosphoerythronate dehydrogenase [Shewanella fidelis]MDW4821417.1 4-phosphoerythronate dehydrogenase [Shewanella fidelis]MDW4824505.1 4-phosphoerythronate dehydrogenase [Shewanella fidelis]